jgi:hypothetical protein
MILTKDQIINYLMITYKYNNIILKNHYFSNDLKLDNKLYIGVVVPLGKKLKSIMAILCKQDYYMNINDNNVILITTIKSYYRSEICQKILN